jgi:hypothetical protein
MTDFSRDELAAAVRDPDYRMKVVMIEEIPDDLDRVVSTYHLDLSGDLEAQFKANVARSIERWPLEGYWEQYVEGWVPEPGQFATAGVDVLEGSRLKAAIDDGLAPGRARLPELGQTELPHARGYALVLARTGNGDPSEQIYLIRRLDPIQHLGRGQARRRGARPTHSHPQPGPAHQHGRRRQHLRRPVATPRAIASVRRDRGGRPSDEPSAFWIGSSVS